MLRTAIKLVKKFFPMLRTLASAVYPYRPTMPYSSNSYRVPLTAVPEQVEVKVSIIRSFLCCSASSSGRLGSLLRSYVTEREGVAVVPTAANWDSRMLGGFWLKFKKHLPDPFLPITELSQLPASLWNGNEDECNEHAVLAICRFTA